MQIPPALAEGVYITVPFLPPINKFYPEFERSAGFAEELVLRNTQHCVETSQGRDRRFADPYRSDRLGFHQGEGPSPVIEEPG